MLEGEIFFLLGDFLGEFWGVILFPVICSARINTGLISVKQWDKYLLLLTYNFLIYCRMSWKAVTTGETVILGVLLPAITKFMEILHHQSYLAVLTRCDKI